MSYYYSLRVATEEANYKNVSDVLEIDLKDYSLGWVYELEVGDEESEGIIFNFINLIELKKKELVAIGINDDQISVWIVYEYSGQCDLEFSPLLLKKIGDNGISLCISCYEI